MTRDNAVAHASLGYRARGELARAEQEIAEALRIRLGSGDARADLGLSCAEQGASATRAAPSAGSQRGGRGDCAHGGLAAERSGDPAAAIASYRRALDVSPDRVEAANNLAFLLATARDPALRAPDEAIALAQRAARAKAFDPAVIDTLAAAYASAGRYREAADTEARARAALPDDASPLRDEIERNLARYRSLAGGAP